jgi:hypothetical protein
MEKHVRDVQNEQPFFTRFIEEQRPMTVKTDVKAGSSWPPAETMKYPSDEADEIFIPFP